jgi:hypothetical protein
VLVKPTTRRSRSPENPGGTVVPNQDNKVYDAVVKGTKPAEPVQQKLVTNTEEPVDVIAKEPQSRVVDLSPDDTDAAAVTNAAGNAANDNTAPGNADATGNADVAAAPKSEDRIAQVLQDADNATNPEIVAVAPRKVEPCWSRPMVRWFHARIRRGPQVAAAEPVDPAPQRVLRRAGRCRADRYRAARCRKQVANADQQAPTRHRCKRRSGNHRSGKCRSRGRRAERVDGEAGGRRQAGRSGQS